MTVRDVHSRRFAQALAFALNCVGPASGQVAFTNLGNINPIGVSTDGSVVGGSANGQAARWTAAGGLEDLGTFPGGTYTVAYGMSGDASTLVGNGDGYPGTCHSFRWTVAGGMEDLGCGYLPVGVNGDGSVVVGLLEGGGYGNDGASRWIASAGWQTLNTDPSGFFALAATSVNSDASVVVGTGLYAEYFRAAFRWTAAGGTQDLGRLEDYFSAPSYIATSVSADGSTVVGTWGDYCASPPCDSPQRLFRWTVDTGMQDLGIPPGSTYGAHAYVSGDGSVVVGYGDNTSFLWTSSLGMVDLRGYLTALGVDLDAYAAFWASGVSADGTAITGFSNHGGWLVTGRGSFDEPTDIGVPCGAPRLTWSGSPTLGGDFTVTTENLGTRIQYLLVDWSNHTSKNFGHVLRGGCPRYVIPDSTLFLGNAAAYTFHIPADLNLLGTHLRVQALIPGLPAAATQALDAVIGG